MFNTLRLPSNIMYSMTTDYERMMQAARRLHGLTSPADVGRLLGKYDQIMTNWKARGIPRAEVLDIAEKIGCNPYWLRDGKGEMISYDNDAKIQKVIIAMQAMPEYKKDVLVQTSSALVEPDKIDRKANQ